MDFSKKGVIKKEHQIKSIPKRLTTKFRVGLFRLALACIVFIAVTGCFAGSGALKGMIDNAPDISQINIDPVGYTSHIYYSDGTLSGTLIGAEANRVYVKIEKIPRHVQLAFIAAEDERFYEHDGIDIRGILRAGVSVLKEQSLGFGASTITQQLLKNKIFNGGNESNSIDKVVRKIQEQYLAIQLEDQFTKEQILEAYLNSINLGNASFGVQVAAQNYFGKNVEDLTLSEATVLSPLALSPVRQNPINYPETNAKRRQKILDLMLENNFCTKEEYDEAIADTKDVYEKINVYAEQRHEEKSYYSYFTDTLLNTLMDDLQNKLGLTSKQATDLIFTGGLKIFTTQDREVQEIVDNYFQNEENFPALGEGSYYELNYALSVRKPDDTVIHYQLHDFIDYFKDYQDTNKIYYHENGKNVGISRYTLDKEDISAKCDEFKAAMLKEGDVIDGETKEITLQPQCSFTLLDQHSGAIVAIYGGRGEKTTNRSLNRASDSLRQVGSTFKVLASFLPALDTSGMTLASVADDSEYYYPGSSSKVENWNRGVYKGLKSIREGIYNSMNIVACRIMEQVTPRVGFEYLKKLGFTSLVESKTDKNGRVYSDINVSLALGGLTYGVTNVELTAAYATIANSGIYNKPIYYTKVLDHNGKVILENKISESGNQVDSNQVIKASTSYLLTSAMRDTTTIGTGTRLAFKNYKMPVAGKTGTSTHNNDLWFVGYTPYYTAAIWTGFDNNFDQAKNKTYHQNLWRNIMEEVHQKKQLENVAFKMPDSIVSATVCTKCGNLAVAGLCENAIGDYGSKVKTEIFAKGSVPTQKCTCHVKVSVCKESGKLANQYCPKEEVKEVVYLKKEETSPTWDTPNILPSGEDSVCKIHSEDTIEPEISEIPEDLNTPDKDPNADPNVPDIDPDANPDSGETTQPSDDKKEEDTPPLVVIPPDEPITPPDNTNNTDNIDNIDNTGKEEDLDTQNLEEP